MATTTDTGKPVKPKARTTPARAARTPRAARAPLAASAPLAAATPAASTPVADDEDAVHARIRQAIFSGLLKPGMKLQEPAIARILQVSRERVRKALHRLVHEKWLDTVPNKGTYIPTSSIDELHAIYDARKVVEMGVTRQLAERYRLVAMERLHAHIQLEQEARANNDRERVFKLSAEFHFLLVQLTRNPYLVDMHQGLMQRSSLHFALYAPPDLHERTAHHCAGPHEHAEIVSALQEGQSARAEKLMQRHLNELEKMLSLRQPVDHFLPLEEVFARLGAPSPSAGS
ncbi:MAG: GntR family transcriptional regulator [Haliea sp.]|nr:MAG: GntR family transcriptional regulator [Haliea sp.]